VNRLPLELLPERSFELSVLSGTMQAKFEGILHKAIPEKG
jgi:hypothetical protein